MSEKKERKKRTVTRLKHPLPDVRISFDSHFDIIAAYVVASDNGKKEVEYKELAPYLKIALQTVGGCNKFFQHLGLLTPSEKGKSYTPTKLAIDLHNARKWKNDQVIKSTLRQILKHSWFWIHTKQYLDVNGSVNREDLIRQLGLECRADPQKHKLALSKLIEYIQNADLIKENSGRFELNSESFQNSENGIDMSSPAKKPTLQDNYSKPKDSTTTFHTGSVNVSLGLLINPETSEEQIRKTIRTVIDELTAIQKEKEESKYDAK